IGRRPTFEKLPRMREVLRARRPAQCPDRRTQAKASAVKLALVPLIVCEFSRVTYGKLGAHETRHSKTSLLLEWEQQLRGIRMAVLAPRKLRPAAAERAGHCGRSRAPAKPKAPELPGSKQTHIRAKTGRMFSGGQLLRLQRPGRRWIRVQRPILRREQSAWRDLWPGIEPRQHPIAGGAAD